MWNNGIAGPFRRYAHVNIRFATPHVYYHIPLVFSEAYVARGGINQCDRIVNCRPSSFGPTWNQHLWWRYTWARFARSATEGGHPPLGSPLL